MACVTDDSMDGIRPVRMLVVKKGSINITHHSEHITGSVLLLFFITGKIKMFLCRIRSMTKVTFYSQ
jgi:hypothetical protein